MTTKTKTKPVELQWYHNLSNILTGCYDVILSPARWYHWCRDCYDNRRNTWRPPKGLERIELVIYGPLNPEKTVKQYGMYTFCTLHFWAVVPNIYSPKKKEIRMVRAFNTRRRQSVRVNQILDKHMNDGGRLQWMPKSIVEGIG